MAVHTTELLLSMLGQGQESPSSGWSYGFPALQQRSCSIILLWQEHHTLALCGDMAEKNPDILNFQLQNISTSRS